MSRDDKSCKKTSLTTSTPSSHWLREDRCRDVLLAIFIIPAHIILVCILFVAPSLLVFYTCFGLFFYWSQSYILLRKMFCMCTYMHGIYAYTQLATIAVVPHTVAKLAICYCILHSGYKNLKWVAILPLPTVIVGSGKNDIFDIFYFSSAILLKMAKTFYEFREPLDC